MAVQYQKSMNESIRWAIRIAFPLVLFISSYYCVTHFESFIISAGYGELLSPYPCFDIPSELVFASVFFSVTVIQLLFLSAFSFLLFVNSLVSFFVAKMESRSAQLDRE